MSTRSVLGSVLVSATILIVGWQAGAAVTTSPTSTATTDTTASDGTSTDSSASSGTDSSTGSSTGSSTDTATDSGTSTDTATASTSDGTYTGSSVSTRFGDVQVEVTISGGAITDVVAVHLTDDDQKSVQISNRAAPVLRGEVLEAQSANVATVSGATYTSDAYLQSLQSALDAAGY